MRSPRGVGVEFSFFLFLFEFGRLGGGFLLFLFFVFFPESMATGSSAGFT